MRIDARRIGRYALFVAALLAFPAHLSRAQGLYEAFVQAVATDRSDEVRALLARGMDPNTVDPNGEPVLLVAARSGWQPTVDALLGEHAMYGTAFFVKNGDRYFINNDRGELVTARLSPKGFTEISRTKLIEPTHPYVRRRQLPNVLWSHAVLLQETHQDRQA
jgi:hypothetical protein